MDYKEKYEQALERAKVINPGTADYEVAVKILPELKENEDERIRKAIIEYLEQSQFGEEHYQVDDDIVRGYIAWLEKQGKKVKHTCRNCQTFQDLHQNCPYSPIYQYTDLTDAHKRLDDETHCEFWLEKQGEQKSTWSEEDERFLKLSLENLAELKNMYGEKYGKVGDCIHWLKSLKYKLIKL